MANMVAIQSLIDTEIERLQRMAAMLAANAAIEGREQCPQWAESNILHNWGGLRTFSAICNNVCCAQNVYFAKSCDWPKAGLSPTLRRRAAAFPKLTLEQFYSLLGTGRS